MCARNKIITNDNLKTLAKDLEETLLSVTTQKGKRVDSLTFAAFITESHGYRFTNQPEWEVLEEAMQKITSKYAHYTTGQVAEMLSIIVNTPACNCTEKLHS